MKHILFMSDNFDFIGSMQFVPALLIIPQKSLQVVGEKLAGAEAIRVYAKCLIVLKEKHLMAN